MSAGRAPPYRGRNPPTADGVADVGGVALFVEVAHAGVGVGGRAVDGLGLAAFVRVPRVSDGQDCVGEVFGILEGEAVAGGRVPGSGLRHIQGHGDRPEQARFQAHRVEHGFVVGAPEKPA